MLCDSVVYMNNKTNDNTTEGREQVIRYIKLEDMCIGDLLTQLALHESIVRPRAEDIFRIEQLRYELRRRDVLVHA